mgnify:CR=1 FL=1|jgi:hypothetical protein|tara:strand:+ start:341 stop:952 length:612 start_codon:yes stop_codon:yes gene_type:complete
MAKDKSMYRSAMGKQIDIDSLRVANETLISVGNMRVNARGDELGPGGVVLRSREEVLADINTPSAPTVTHADQQNPNVPINSPIKSAPPATPVEVAMDQPAVPISFPADVDNEDEVVLRPDPVPAPIPDPQPIVAQPVPQVVPDVVPAPTPPVVEEDSQSIIEVGAPVQPTVRGTLASSVAGGATVVQETETPPNKANGPRRL